MGSETSEAQPSIAGIKNHRRARVAILLDHFGQTGLSGRVEIAASYLYQMGKAQAGKARGVSDANASKIERSLGLPPGWIDSNDPLPELKAIPNAHPLPAAAIDDLHHIKLLLAALFSRMAEAQPGEAKRLADRIQQLSGEASNPFMQMVVRTLRAIPEPTEIRVSSTHADVPRSTVDT
jgi:hypothetical protein